MNFKRTIAVLFLGLALGCSADQGASWLARGVAQAAQRCAIKVALHRYGTEAGNESHRPAPLRVQDPAMVERAIARVPPRRTTPAATVRAEASAVAPVQPLPIARDLSSVKPFRLPSEPGEGTLIAFSRNTLPEVVVVHRVHSVIVCTSRAAA
ncbi:MAG: hypothetical protein ABR524_10135 [Thermoanaerobaculia bacterium]